MFFTLCRCGVHSQPIWIPNDDNFRGNGGHVLHVSVLYSTYMKIIYIDESGYTKNWEENISEQPWYTLSAVIIPANLVGKASTVLKQDVKKLNIPWQEKPIGEGFEIKAKEISQGKNYWVNNNYERNTIREKMLSFPKRNNRIAIVVIEPNEQ